MTLYIFFSSAAVIEHVLNNSYSLIPGPRVRMVQSRATSQCEVNLSQVTEICWSVITAAQPCLFLTDTSKAPSPCRIPDNHSVFLFVLEEFSCIRSTLGTTFILHSQVLASRSSSLQNVRSWRSLHPLSLSGMHSETQPFVPVSTFTRLTSPLLLSLPRF